MLENGQYMKFYTSGVTSGLPVDGHKPWMSINYKPF